jgi:hypothetical protein
MSKLGGIQLHNDDHEPTCTVTPPRAGVGIAAASCGWASRRLWRRNRPRPSSLLTARRIQRVHMTLSSARGSARHRPHGHSATVFPGCELPWRHVVQCDKDMWQIGRGKASKQCSHYEVLRRRAEGNIPFRDRLPADRNKRQR